MPFGWPIPHLLLNLFFFFFPEGIILLYSQDFFFLFALHKVLTHVANSCVLVVRLILPV